ncbi:MAG: hypothetical protein C0506_10020 [Anaerolinea sp.]|nr:hypothetical protein [Anaerolinea sp.]
MKPRSALECDVHLVPLSPGEPCAYCLRFLESAPDPDQIPPAVRLDELERWLTATPAVPLELLYRRIEQLVGRPISLHELEDPDLLMRRAQRPRRLGGLYDDFWQ